jgi:hypothetical protein
MVREVRGIMLSLDEVQNAFVCYQRMTPHFLPHSLIKGCKTETDGVTLMVETASGGNSTQRSSELTLRGIDVLRPLIRYCIENNIMLPREGRKSVLIKKDLIALHIELIAVGHGAPSGPMRVSESVELGAEKVAATNTG